MIRAFLDRVRVHGRLLAVCGLGRCPSHILSIRLLVEEGAVDLEQTLHRFSTLVEHTEQRPTLAVDQPLYSAHRVVRGLSDADLSTQFSVPPPRTDEPKLPTEDRRTLNCGLPLPSCHEHDEGSGHSRVHRPRSQRSPDMQSATQCGQAQRVRPNSRTHGRLLGGCHGLLFPYAKPQRAFAAHITEGNAEYDDAIPS